MMAVASKILKELLVVVLVCLGLSMSSCQWATSESDLPLEEWVVTSVYVKYADSSKTTYDTHVAINYADSSLASGQFTDDYDGKVGTDPLTLYTISSYTISAGASTGFLLTSAPDPATHPVVTFDTNHYFYRTESPAGLGRYPVAKCHIKTPSIAITFEQ